jgi:hypothetical protein
MNPIDIDNLWWGNQWRKGKGRIISIRRLERQGGRPESGDDRDEVEMNVGSEGRKGVVSGNHKQ